MHIDQLQAKTSDASEKTVERCLIHGSRQHGRGGLDAYAELSEDPARGGTDSPHYVHLVLDSRRHLSLPTSASLKRCSRDPVAGHLRGARRQGMSSRVPRTLTRPLATVGSPRQRSVSAAITLDD